MRRLLAVCGVTLALAVGGLRLLRTSLPCPNCYRQAGTPRGDHCSLCHGNSAL